MTATREKILNSLPSCIHAPLSDVLATPDLQGIPLGTVRGALRDFRKAGLVVHNGYGWRRTMGL
jgi:hypothetical protein